MSLRQPARKNSAKQAVLRDFAVPAPVEGWDASTALAAMPPLRAVQLKNWFPQPGYVEVRRGYRFWSWGVGTSTTPVETLAIWRGPASSKMFAAGGGKIYDVTSNAVASSSVTSLSNNRWQWINHTTSAGAYLWMCNGVDAVRHYNGTAWATPSLTGVTSTDVVAVCAHKKRIWMAVKDSTKGYYLATEAVAGAATAFEFGSNFTRGGYLNAIVTWTRDGGNGADDYLIAISSQGDAAVYQGTDPASANTWALVGVFQLAPPIGRRCFLQFGGNVLVLTQQGIIPLSQMLALDTTQSNLVANSARISQALTSQATSYSSNFGWEICAYPRGNRIIVNIPTTENQTAIQYVQNSITGAWCEFESMNANCWAVFGDRLFFGDNTGKVYRADTGSTDVDEPITATGQCAYQAFGSRGRVKRFSLVKPLITTTGTHRPSLGVSTDFVETTNMSTAAVGTTQTTSTWDSSVWDSSTWAGDTVQVNDWVGGLAIGTFASIKFKAITGQNSGGTAWGVSLWGTDLWGSQGNSDEPMKINGFVVLAEVGGQL